jgi:hypothetical protein
MSAVLTNRQRAQLYQRHGAPVLALEFDVFAPGQQVSMWAHTRHDIPFAEMQRAFEAIAEHLRRFLADGAMCPFNPAFVQEADAEQAHTSHQAD